MSDLSNGLGIPALIIGILIAVYGLFYMGIVNQKPSIPLFIGGIVFIIVGAVVLSIK